MPYTRPVSAPIKSTTPVTPFPKLSASSYSLGGDKNSSSPTWPLAKITFGSSKTKPLSSTTTLLDVFAANSQNSKSSTSPFPPKSQPVDIQRKKALEEVKEIISTSPQFSTSPRRTKSSPEAYRRLHHIDLQSVLPPKIITSDLAVLRRKNGEIVKSSLKSKSEPTTPTCPKFVHFDADLEQVRFFLEAEKPQAVSCDVSSEEEESDDDNEYSLSDDDEDDDEGDLIITLPNFPRLTTAHSSKPVFVESICLSKDQRKLQGRVQVQNIAFHKTVVIRYTFDFWSSVSEVTASYSENAQDRKNQNFDVFVFSIDLIDNSRNPINGQTMYFAVRYNVDNRDLWDNNNASNYQVNFKRLTKQAPPRASRNSRPKSSWSSSPNSTMVSGSLESDELARSPNASKSRISPNAVSKTRYDINQSLSVAMTKPQAPAFNPRPTPSPSTMQHFNHHVLPYSLAYNGNDNFHAIFGNCVDGQPCTLDTSMSIDASKQINMTRNFEGSRPIAIPTSASKPVLGSSSYYDFVDRYCFYQGGSSPHTIYASSPPVMI